MPCNEVVRYFKIKIPQPLVKTVRITQFKTISVDVPSAPQIRTETKEKYVTVMSVKDNVVTVTKQVDVPVPTTAMRTVCLPVPTTIKNNVTKEVVVTQTVCKPVPVTVQNFVTRSIPITVTQKVPVHETVTNHVNVPVTVEKNQVKTVTITVQAEKSSSPAYSSEQNVPDKKGSLHSSGADVCSVPGMCLIEQQIEYKTIPIPSDQTTFVEEMCPCENAFCLNPCASVSDTHSHPHALLRGAQIASN